MKTWLSPLVAMLGLWTAPVWADDDHAEPDGAPTGVCEKPVSVTSDKPALDGLALEIAELYSRGLLAYCEDVPELAPESEALEPLTPCCNCTPPGGGKKDPWSDLSTFNTNLKTSYSLTFGSGFGYPELNCGHYNVCYCTTCNDSHSNPINVIWKTTDTKTIGCQVYKYNITYSRSAIHNYCAGMPFTTNKSEEVKVLKYKCICGCVCPVSTTTWTPTTCNYHGSNSFMQCGTTYYNVNPYLISAPT
jgi:hypothetical protein